MTSSHRAAVLACVSLAIGSGCEGPGLEPIGPVSGVAAPSGRGSGQPFLSSAGDGAVLMSWMEAAEDGHAVRYSRFEDGVWSAARTLTESGSFFVNWADFPSIIELSDGRLAAHWLARSGPGTYAYDVLISVSDPGGTRWSDAMRPHRDGTETEHGFVSLFEHEGRLAAVWLDGRRYAGPDVTGSEGDSEVATNEMTVRFTTLGADGPGAELRIDDRSCDCCQTDVAITGSGPVVVYRDRSGSEIRDIAVSRWVAGGWSEPVPVHDDGWEIAGCPVNGPAIAANGQDAAVAWFTAARDTAKVLVAFSHDGAASFAAPVRVDSGDPLGRVDALLLDDGTAVVTWLERVPDGAKVLARRIAADGSTSEPVEIGGTSADRPAGFPRMARSGEAIVFAWTVPGDSSVIELATARLPGR